MRYNKGTMGFDLGYKTNDKFLIGYSDSDHAGNTNDKKFNLEFVFLLGSGPISWMSKKQNYDSRSSTKSEYRTPGILHEVVWL